MQPISDLLAGGVISFYHFLQHLIPFDLLFLGSGFGQFLQTTFCLTEFLRSSSPPLIGLLQVLAESLQIRLDGVLISDGQNFV